MGVAEWWARYTARLEAARPKDEGQAASDDAEPPAETGWDGQRLRELNVLALVLHSTGTIDEMISALVQKGPEVTDAMAVYPLLLDKRRDVLHGRHLEGVDDPHLDRLNAAFDMDLSEVEYPLPVSHPRRVALDTGDVASLETLRDFAEDVVGRKACDAAGKKPAQERHEGVEPEAEEGSQEPARPRDLEAAEPPARDEHALSPPKVNLAPVRRFLHARHPIVTVPCRERQNEPLYLDASARSEQRHHPFRAKVRESGDYGVGVYHGFPLRDLIQQFQDRPLRCRIEDLPVPFAPRLRSEGLAQRVGVFHAAGLVSPDQARLAPLRGRGPEQPVAVQYQLLVQRHRRHPCGQRILRVKVDFRCPARLEEVGVPAQLQGAETTHMRRLIEHGAERRDYVLPLERGTRPPVHPACYGLQPASLYILRDQLSRISVAAEPRSRGEPPSGEERL